MKKFWIKFKQNIQDNPPVGTLLGIGITTYSVRSALKMIENKIYKSNLPEIVEIKVIDSLEELDKFHVQPNIGNVLKEGIWFPLGYE